MKQTLQGFSPDAMSLEKSPQRIDKRVVLNIGGTRHETWLSTLERIPGTRLSLLAQLQEADESYDEDRGEYFFDKNPRAFESVMQYCRTEEFHVDQNLCGNGVKGEFRFWGLLEQDIEPCCWANYSRFNEHKQTLQELDDNFAFAAIEAWGDENSKYHIWAERIWKFLEDPSSSRAAKVYAIVAMFFVVMSIGIFVAESHRVFQVDRKTEIPITILQPEEPPTPTGYSTSGVCCKKYNFTVKFEKKAHPVLEALDYFCAAYFTMEIIVRFIFAPYKLVFIKTPLNIIDFVCLVPHYISIVIKLVDPNNKTATLFKTVMMLRVVRILRIFKLMKHYSAFKILVYTIKVSTKELLLMVVFLMSGVLMFASVIHFVEGENFPNIPIGLWWALVTMTTVGYGDKYPVTVPGFLVGTICVVCGVLVIAFTVPIVVNNFSLYYSHAQSRIKLKDKNKSRRKARLKRSTESLRSEGTATARSMTPNDHYDPNIQSKPKEQDKIINKGSEIQNYLNILNETKKGSKQVQMHGLAGEKDQQKPTFGNTKPVKMTDIAECTSPDMETSNSEAKRHEEETRQLLNSLADANQKFDDERKRQEWLLQKKREQRIRLNNLKKEPEQAPDAKSGEKVAFQGAKGEKK